MALNEKDLKALFKATNAASLNPAVKFSYAGENFSYVELNDTLRKELKEIAGTYKLYRQNKALVFSLIEEAIDDILPKKVMEQWGQFAEVKTFAQGDRPVFIQRITVAAKRRAKQFITRVGLAGIYEVFKLDGTEYEVKTGAYGGACQIGFEEFLDGRVDWADVAQIVTEGLDEIVYQEISKALIGAVKTLQTANKAKVTGFDETKMDQLIAIADSYGQATIYCTFEFAAKMLPDVAWASDEIKNKKWNDGYLGNYKRHNVIVLPQSYTDETNTQKVIDPGFVWIIPTGAEKPVKIALEGETIVRDYENKDMSREMQVYKKMGVGALIKNNICVYVDTQLAFDAAAVNDLFT